MPKIPKLRARETVECKPHNIDKKTALRLIASMENPQGDGADAVLDWLICSFANGGFAVNSGRGAVRVILGEVVLEDEFKEGGS